MLLEWNQTGKQDSQEQGESVCVENSRANEEKSTGEGEAYRIVKMLRIVQL